MYATAEITLDRRPAVLSVPIESLDRAAGAASVVVVDADHRIERREISLGLETPERVEVTAGLHENDLVVLGNRAQLKPGTTVAPQLQAVRAEE
jgi:multidrug efflux pump subunit AcrA (membrane-fusion protein)